MWIDLAVVFLAISILWLSGLSIIHLVSGRISGSPGFSHIMLAFPLGLVFYSTITIFLSLVSSKNQLITSFYVIISVDILFILLKALVFVKGSRFKKENKALYTPEPRRAEHIIFT